MNIYRLFHWCQHNNNKALWIQEHILSRVIQWNVQQDLVCLIKASRLEVWWLNQDVSHYRLASWHSPPAGKLSGPDGKGQHPASQLDTWIGSVPWKDLFVTNKTGKGRPVYQQWSHAIKCLLNSFWCLQTKISLYLFFSLPCHANYLNVYLFVWLNLQFHFRLLASTFTQVFYSQTHIGHGFTLALNCFILEISCWLPIWTTLCWAGFGESVCHLIFIDDIWSILLGQSSHVFVV